MRNKPTPAPAFRADLFQETPPVWRNPGLRQALRPAPAALVERVMASMRETDDDGAA